MTLNRELVRVARGMVAIRARVRHDHQLPSAQAAPRQTGVESTEKFCFDDLPL
jgi:hypothetical protein